MTVKTMEQLQELLVKEQAYDYYKAASRFEQLPIETFEDFQASELFAFLPTILSEERMMLLEKLLPLLKGIPYSDSYYRRSYRAPNNIKLHSGRVIKFILWLKNQPAYDFYDVFERGVRMSYIQDTWHFVTEDKTPIMATELFTYELALQLNANDARTESYVRDILWKNGAHPLYTRELIRGIMMSENEEMHALLMNVLLAAKNQEGVRQTIMESIDEGSVKAQLSFMKAVLEHDLLRFSSVVRAIDVWFGLGYDVTNRKQLQYVIETSYAALQDGALVEKLLESDSNLDIFIALWCLASVDVNAVLKRVPELLTRADYVQQTVLYMLRNVGTTRYVDELVYPHMLETTNFITFMYGFPFVANSFPYASSYNDESEQQLVTRFFKKHPWLAEHATAWLKKTEQILSEFRGDTYEVKSTPFPFLNVTFDKLDVFKLQLLLALHLQDEAYVQQLAKTVTSMSVGCREYFYAFAPAYLENYDLLMPALKDRSSSVRAEVLERLQKLPIPFEQLKSYVPSLLALKSGETRISVIRLLKKQPLGEIETLAMELLQHKKEPVRLGTLELLTELKEQLPVREWASYIEQPTEKEANYLRQFEQKKVSFLDVTLEPIHYATEPNTDLFYTFHYFIAHDFDLLVQKLESLRALIAEHAEVAYERKGYSENVTTLIGEYLTSDANKPQQSGSIDELPLAEVWYQWMDDCNLTVDDVYCYIYLKAVGENFYWKRRDLTEKMLAFLNVYMPEERQNKLFHLFDDAPYERQVSKIMHYFVARGKGPLQTKLREHLDSVAFDYVQFCSEMLCELIQTHRDVDLGMKYNDVPCTLLDVQFFREAFSEISFYAHTLQDVNQYFYTASFYADRVEDYFNYCSFEDTLLAYANNMLTDDHMRRILCMDRFSDMLELSESTRKTIDWYNCAEQVYALIASVQAYIIEEELARGDLEARTTRLVRRIREVKGIDYFIRLLQALGEEKLSRQWMYGVQTRKDSLSTLLGRAVLDPEETKEQCFNKLDAAGFTAERLIEVMLYNSQFIPLISEYIGWEGLEDVAWYFIAHTTESTTNVEAAKIMEYSEIPMADFQRGAFDRTWFMNARASLTKKQFDAVYNAAKYATSGSNHRRAQLYARASLGELDGEQLLEEIRTKRNKDKLRAYSLLPVTMEEAKKRYVFFQQFLKESRQFGAQRRASEAEAVEMAIYNLAQQVASGNTTQFMWQMEQARYKELEAFFTPIELDGVQLCLVHEDKLELRVIKNGKQLKSVPKKLAKHEVVLAMQEAKKELTEQYRRTRQQLEVAMCEEVEFDAQIIYALLDNPFLSELLSPLVWKQGEAFYAVCDKQFVTSSNEVVHVEGIMQIAHPAHFYAAGNWRTWQHFLFERGYKQPFKQVFREFYLPTADERGAVFTKRFEGYQIQPTKAMALLKARGWKSSYEELPRKISYRYNVITHVNFVYDYFTPGDVEAPTLQTIYFEGRLTNKSVKLGDVAPVHFSEVMRDVDLVVSVAHAGEVDPEASHSTIEMRAVIAEEMIQLFQLTNAKVQAPHILINGALGNYSIHLGSGNVHQLGGAMIPVIAIPSQHRGRVFLPFVDEDPKTAEISAKLLLFAEDDKINDPMIRASIR